MKKLTDNERYVARMALSNALDSMEWDEDYGAYTDGGRFILTLDKEELEALKSAVKKL